MTIKIKKALELIKIIEVIFQSKSLSWEERIALDKAKKYLKQITESAIERSGEVSDRFNFMRQLDDYKKEEKAIELYNKATKESLLISNEEVKIEFPPFDFSNKFEKEAPANMSLMINSVFELHGIVLNYI